jgi:hypothetical protein
MQPFSIDFGAKVEMPQSVVEPEIEDNDISDEIDQDEIVTEPEPKEPEKMQVQSDSSGDDVSDEPEYGGKTGSAILAEYYKSKDLLPEDYEIPANLNAEQLAKAIEENIGRRKSEEIEDEYRSKGYDDRLIEYAAIIAQGGNPEDLQVHAQYDMLAQYDTDKTEDMKRVITYMYQDKGLKEREINRLIENADYDDDIEELFKEARSYFGEKRDGYLEEVRNSLLEEQKRQEKAIKQTQDKYRNTIRSKALNDLLISDEEAKKFERDFMEPTERYIHKNEDGTTKAMKITKYQKRMMEIQDNPEKTLEVAYYILYGFKPVKEKAKAEAMSELDKILNPKEVLRTQKVSSDNKAVTTSTGKLLFQL